MFCRLIFIMIIAVAVGQMLYNYPALPEILASQFDGSGNPKSWMPKTWYLWINFAVVGSSVLIFLVLPKAIYRRQAGQQNRGSKWLKPSMPQSPEAAAYFGNAMSVFGSAHVLFLAFVNQLVIDANFSARPQLSNAFYWALIAYAIFVTVWLIALFRKMRTFS